MLLQAGCFKNDQESEGEKRSRRDTQESEAGDGGSFEPSKPALTRLDCTAASVLPTA